MDLEKIKSLSIDEVKERLTELRSKDINSMKLEEMQEIEKEVDALNERRQALRDDAQAKQELRNKILTGEVETQEIEKPKETRTMDLNKENYLSSKEYRRAFLKTLQGRDLNEEERTAITLADANAVVPSELQDHILTKVKEYAPVLNDITLLNVNGAVRFAVEGVNNEAEDHVENATINASSDTMVEVELTTHEITKLIQISASVKSMSIDSFEAWLVNQLAEAIAMKIEGKVFNAMMSTANAVGEGITTDNVFKLFGALKTGYARYGKVYMSRNTLYTKVLGLQDKAKNDLVTFENGVYKLLGVTIEPTDSVTGILFCAPKKFVGNLAEAINVKNQYDINTNSYKYLGVANFDGKVGIAEAFQKLTVA